jgi:hypothetical protein
VPVPPVVFHFKWKLRSVAFERTPMFGAFNDALVVVRIRVPQPLPSSVTPSTKTSVVSVKSPRPTWIRSPAIAFSAALRGVRYGALWLPSPVVSLPSVRTYHTLR